MGIKQDISKTWNEVPSPIRGGVYLVGIGIVGYFGYTLYKKWKISSDAQEIKDRMASYEQAGVRQTYVDSQYQSFHDTISNAIENNLMVDISAIYGVFQKLKNDVDFLKLQEYTYDHKFIKLLWTDTYTLDEYLKRNLSSSQISQINNILKSKRINYQF